jgi:hypothetical protein
MESPFWDGRNAIVVAGDIAVYEAWRRTSHRWRWLRCHARHAQRAAAL